MFWKKKKDVVKVITKTKSEEEEKKLKEKRERLRNEFTCPTCGGWASLDNVKGVFTFWCHYSCDKCGTHYKAK